MTNGWGGADPTTNSGDTADYELGTHYKANVDVTLTSIRVYSDGTESGFVNRKGRIWTLDGTLLGQATLANTLPSGWSVYALDSPVGIHAGSHFIVSYSTGGKYVALANALNADVNSSDNSLTALATTNALGGNGLFNNTPTSLPLDNFGAPFYGVDVVFSTGLSSGNPPVITGVSLSISNLAVTATISATDVDGLSGATYAIDWGDGGNSSGSSNSFTHTYSRSGSHAALVSVTDSTGLADYAAVLIAVQDLLSLNVTEIKNLYKAMVDEALATGLFKTVNMHEPKNAPSSDLHCAIYASYIGPCPGQSGLAITTGLLRFNARIYKSFITKPEDDIDPAITWATLELMNKFSNDFTLGGIVREVDLLGQSGSKLEAVAGYLTIDNKLYRVMTLNVPIIVNDLWVEAA